MSSAANCVFQTLYMSVRQGSLVDIGFRPLRPEPATAAHSPWHGNLVLTLLHSPGFLLSLPAHWPLSPSPVINDPMCSQSHWLLPALLHAATVLQAPAHLLLRFPSPTSDPGALSELWTSSWSWGGSRLWEPIRTGSPTGSWWLVQSHFSPEGWIGSEPEVLDHSDTPWWLGIRRHGPALGHGRGNGFCLLCNLC